MVRYEIRAAQQSDEDELLRLAGHLNTINLPHDRESIRALLEHASSSFAGDVEDPRERRFVFVLWDLELGTAVGTSMIVGQHGQPNAPYIYFDVIPEEKYHRSLDRHFHHTLLRIGFSYRGPTEIGGLIVDPTYRESPQRLGLLISYVRFLFIAARRELFQDELVAELLPPLEKDGTSHLWEALGRHFTGMSYAEADFLSSQDKSFIRDLFPGGVIYSAVLSPEAQRVIGEVGAQTKGVEKMLRRIGFRYAERVDPFDGGPHFVAATDQVTLVRSTYRGVVSGVLEPSELGRLALVARLSEQPPFLRAVRSTYSSRGTHSKDSAPRVRLPTATRAHLALEDGDEVVVLPLRR